ncbi:MAG TPA: serine hydrolase domain-containing protein [Thermoanaerobaculia bacterium]
MKRKDFLRVVPCRSPALVFAGLLLATAPSYGRPPAGQAGDRGPASPSSPSKKSLSSSPSSDLSRLAEAAVKDGRTAGISFVVTKGGVVVSSGAYGFADLENRVPANVDTVYAIGSLTKTFTAAAVLALADDGKLSLDDPLGRFVPSFQEPGRSATVRQLLNHTSGIRSMTSLGPRYWAQSGREIEPADLVALFANEPSDFPPGTAYRYSNSGYVLLGLVVEKASGMPWGAFVAKRFLVPLGLSGTRDGQTADLVPGRARGYSRTKAGGFENAWHVSLTQGYAAGALLSTAPDVAAWMRRLTNAQGVGVDTFAGRKRLFHGGGLPGFDAWAAHVPGDDLVVAVLCNTDGDVAMEVADAIAGLVLGVPGAKTVRPRP